MLVMRALDAATLRHAATASNIANASNRNYQPLRVDFEQQLVLARSELLRRDDDAAARRALQNVQPRLESDAFGTARKVQLDEEVAKMMQNTVYYQALLTAKGKHSAILRTAIREGRN